MKLFSEEVELKKKKAITKIDKLAIKVNVFLLPLSISLVFRLQVSEGTRDIWAIWAPAHPRFIRVGNPIKQTPLRVKLASFGRKQGRQIGRKEMSTIRVPKKYLKILIFIYLFFANSGVNWLKIANLFTRESAFPNGCWFCRTICPLEAWLWRRLFVPQKQYRGLDL